MNSVREYHNEAVRLGQLAAVALHKGNEAEGKQHLRRAMVCETKAADLLQDDQASEPTRAILYRSAASFAYQAERLIFKGLSGYPTMLAKQQLLEVQELVRQAIQNPQTTKKGSRLPTQDIITAIYENGALHPTAALPLKEHQQVDIQLLPELLATHS